MSDDLDFDALEKELDRTPGLGPEIERLLLKGTCSAAPPIFGAMTRLGIHNDRDKLVQAYEYVSEQSGD